MQKIVVGESPTRTSERSIIIALNDNSIIGNWSSIEISSLAYTFNRSINLFTIASANPLLLAVRVAEVRCLIPNNAQILEKNTDR